MYITDILSLSARRGKACSPARWSPWSGHVRQAEEGSKDDAKENDFFKQDMKKEYDITKEDSIYKEDLMEENAIEVDNFWP